MNQNLAADATFLLLEFTNFPLELLYPAEYLCLFLFPPLQHPGLQLLLAADQLTSGAWGLVQQTSPHLLFGLQLGHDLVLQVIRFLTLQKLSDELCHLLGKNYPTLVDFVRIAFLRRHESRQGRPGLVLQRSRPSRATWTMPNSASA